MSKYVIIKTLIIPKIFNEQYEEFLKLVEGDEGFNALINRKKTKDGVTDKRYKINKQNKMESIKIRYAISVFHKQLKLKKMKEESNEEIIIK